jgi:hypothetical protein
VSDFDEFKSYYALADKLMQAMTLEQLADCLRILALHIGDYRLRFGAIPGQDLLAPARDYRDQRQPSPRA